MDKCLSVVIVMVALVCSGGCDSSSAPKSVAVDVHLRNDAEIALNGKVIQGRGSFVAAVIKEIADEQRRYELTSPLTIHVDEATTVSFLKEIVIELESAHFSKVFLASGESRTLLTVPMSTVSETVDTEWHGVTVSLNSGVNGRLSSAKMSSTDHSAEAEGDSTAVICSQMVAEIDKVRTKVGGSSPVDVDVQPDDKLAAKELAEICAVLSKANQNEGSLPQLAIWPFGFPREEAIAEVDLTFDAVVEDVETTEELETEQDMEELIDLVEPGGGLQTFDDEFKLD